MNKSIKQLGKIEEDPSQYLTASKANENADLKRQLDTKIIEL